MSNIVVTRNSTVYEQNMRAAYEAAQRAGDLNAWRFDVNTYGSGNYEVHHIISASIDDEYKVFFENLSGISGGKLNFDLNASGNLIRGWHR